MEKSAKRTFMEISPKKSPKAEKRRDDGVMEEEKKSEKERKESSEVNISDGFFSGQEDDQYDEKSHETFTDELYTVSEFEKQSHQVQIVFLEKEEVPIKFKLILKGPWTRTWVEKGDKVRVLGSFKKEKNFTLLLKDPYMQDPHD